MLNADQQRLIQILVQQVSQGRLTQRILTNSTGVHQSQVSRILAGQARRASKNVIKLCKYAEALSGNAPTTSDFEDKALETLARLFGEGHAADAALAKLVASLEDWRKSWEIRR